MLLFPQPFRVKVRRCFIHVYSSETAIGSKDIQTSWAHGSCSSPQDVGQIALRDTNTGLTHLKIFLILNK
jgi:hypothetical protein